MGFDCGGSSTKCRVVDDSGEIVYEAKAGSANLATTPLEVIRENFQTVLADAPKPNACAACFAGLLTPADSLRAKGLMAELLPDVPSTVHVDYEAALAADPDANTILISGTGCIVVSHPPVDSKTSTLVKTGGGGALLGDQGSVFDLGRIALRLTLIENPDAPLTDVFKQTLVDLFGASDRDHVLSAVYQSTSPAARVAKIASAVALDWHRRIPYAVESVNQLLANLSRQIVVHATSVKSLPDPWNVRLTGGLWDVEPDWADEFSSYPHKWGETQPTTVEFRILDRPPVEGAVNLAKQIEL